jgi:type IV secretion system pilin
MIKNLKEKKVITKNIKKVLAGILVVPLAMFGIVAVAAPAYAVDGSGPNCTVGSSENASNDSLSLQSGSNCTGTKNQGQDLTVVFKTVVNILLFIVGAVAVIMLVIGGLRYVTSNGDQNAVTGAKNTILYAIIGIVVAFLAYAAVQFVTSQLEASNGEGGGNGYIVSKHTA